MNDESGESKHRLPAGRLFCASSVGVDQSSSTSRSGRVSVGMKSKSVRGPLSHMLCCLLLLTSAVIAVFILSTRTPAVRTSTTSKVLTRAFCTVVRIAILAV